MVKVIAQRSPIRPGFQAPNGDSGEPTFVFRSAVSGNGVPAGHLSLCDESFPVCWFYVRGVSHSPIFGASCLTQNVVSHNRPV